MTATHLTTKPTKPEHSFTDPKQPFPLTANGAGYWSKKINQHVHYFGRWDIGPEAAEAQYNAWVAQQAREASPLTNGQPTAVTIKQVLNDYWNHMARRAKDGDISPRTLLDVERTTDFLAKNLDKQRPVNSLKPDDFAALKTALTKLTNKGKAKSLVVLGNDITRVKGVFTYAERNLEGVQATKYGTMFDKPRADRIEDQKAAVVEQHGQRTFTAAEVQAMLKAASQPLRAMILLAINAGLTPSEIGHLKHSDIKGRWLTDRRRKRGRVARRVYLWEETVAALTDWQKQRPQPAPGVDGKLLFLQANGKAWSNDHTTHGSEVCIHFRRLLDSLNINGQRSFYTIRHSHRTAASNARDEAAADAVMGHRMPGMRKVYLHDISDERLQHVAGVVHDWLFIDPDKGAHVRDRKGKLVPVKGKVIASGKTKVDKKPSRANV
jgi:integrase